MKKRILNALIGGDIEVFLMHKESGEIVSAEGYAKGTKHQPFNFDPSNKYFAVSLDNVAYEFCIPPVPVTDKDGFVKNIARCLEWINREIPEQLCTVVRPAAILDDRWLQTDNAKLFGCEPDYNVWLRAMNPKPEATNSNLRSAGGHIHIGYDDPSMETTEQIIKCMDLFVGVPSVIQEPDNERKLLYGKAGAFRFKPYGGEYRTISNYYAGDERLTEWVFRATNRAIDAVNDDFPVDEYKDEILDAINNNNKTVAGNLIRALDMELA